MSSDLDVVFLAVSDGLLHDQRISRMKATRNIGMVNQGEKF